jgi:hypothetical protein
MTRKPVGITWADDSLTVVCDDGAVYWTSAVDQGWKEAAPIPGSAADLARARPVAGVPSGPEAPVRRFAKEGEV